jgi:hypothetical protein
MEEETESQKRKRTSPDVLESDAAESEIDLLLLSQRD